VLSAPAASRAILQQHYGTLLPLSLYMPRMQYWLHGARTVQELDVLAYHGPGQAACWWGAACNLFGSQIQNAYPIPGFRVVSRRQIGHFTLVRMVAARPELLTRAMVAAALTTTTLRRDSLLLQRPAG
jgi:hypothetical protein